MSKEIIDNHIHFMRLLIMQKGFSIPLVILIISVLILIPLVFWFSTNNVNLSFSQRNVRGTSTADSGYARPGFGVSISSSKSQTWDLVEYLCTSLEECASSLESGTRWGTVSGGPTSLHEVIVEYSSDWKKFKYVKFFVRSGSFSNSKPFTILELGNFPESRVYTLKDNGREIQVVIAPVFEIESRYFKSAHFSD